MVDQALLTARYKAYRCASCASIALSEEELLAQPCTLGEGGRHGPSEVAWLATVEALEAARGARDYYSHRLAALHVDLKHLADELGGRWGEDDIAVKRIKEMLAAEAQPVAPGSHAVGDRS